MPTTVTRKGQVTIPMPVRNLLGIGPGSQVSFDLAPDGPVVLTICVPRPPTHFTRFRGASGPGMTSNKIMAPTRGETGPSSAATRCWTSSPRTPPGAIGSRAS